MHWASTRNTPRAISTTSPIPRRRSAACPGASTASAPSSMPRSSMRCAASPTTERRCRRSRPTSTPSSLPGSSTTRSTTIDAEGLGSSLRALLELGESGRDVVRIRQRDVRRQDLVHALTRVVQRGRRPGGRPGVPASVHSEVTQAPLAGARVDPRRALAEEGAAGAHLVQDLVQPELVPHRDAGERLTCESRDLHVEDDLLEVEDHGATQQTRACLLYTSPSPRDGLLSRM